MITLVPIGEVKDAVLKSLAPPLAEIFAQETEVAGPLLLPQGGWSRTRRQYLASALLALVPFPARGDRALGIADVDLYAPGLNFVFGIADTDGRRALISLARLRPQFYGSPPDDALLLQRAVKEAVHELGHTYGLGHCRDPRCIMFFSNTLHDTDVKGPGFCAACNKKVDRGMRG
ncbi:MAG: archaemetzincin family Zn-dependent metalloprotease [Dehalococcoidia bacterium]|nr:archaemetzincin family Zn-dependent metalloprotease [Dehalococcoidia bacterium]